MNSQVRPPMVSVVGMSGAGKTTLLEKLIPAMKGRGLRVGTIKHDVHGFEMDKPGKDSWRHKHAGARITVISSPYQIGMVMDVDYDHKLDELYGFFTGVDIILTEGYKQENTSKLEVLRPEVYDRPICKNDKNLLALVSDVVLDVGVPLFSTDDVEGITDFLIRHFKLSPGISSDRRKAVF